MVIQFQDIVGYVGKGEDHQVGYVLVTVSYYTSKFLRFYNLP